MVMPLAFFDFLGIKEILIIAIIGVLLYGERLPEVAGSWAKQFMELKKSMQGIRNEIESVAFDTKQSVTRSMEKADDGYHDEATAPKFEPPPHEPGASGSAAEEHGSPGDRPSDNS